MTTKGFKLPTIPTVDTTVNSRYSGHSRDRDLVSLIARARNSGVRENFYFKTYLQERKRIHGSETVKVKVR